MKIERTKFITALGLTSLLTVGIGHLASAQMPGAPGAGPGGASGPIDITAEEQEFSGETVIARGNVRVIYKDSTIVAPHAVLTRDAGGNPSKAVFTGHPRLTQGTSKIDATKLTFEIAVNKIVAEGNAHSEVEIPADEKKESTEGIAAAAPVKVAPVPKDEDEDEDETPVAVAPVAKPVEKEKKKGPERIITDADRQEYDSATGRFDALGHVRVVHGDIRVNADKLQLVYGLNNKPETALFTGNVVATQNRNSTAADAITYSLSTKRMQATGNVKSKVIQEKAEAPKKGESGPTASVGDLFMGPAKASNGSSNKSAQQQKQLQAEISSAAPAIMPAAANATPGEDKPIWIFSDAQDYSRESGRVSAHGNVKVVYGEMYGSGPSIILTKKPDGKADKVYFQGRSQISQPGRRWIADEITFVVDEKRVIAQGNSKAMILNTGADSGVLGGGRKKAPSSAPVQPTRDNSRIAQPPSGRISASKVEATR